MQQFVVPQFIDVEDKILGPITVRQFLILLVAGGLIFLGYRFGDLATFGIVLVVVGGIAAAFAFGRVNGQNFHYFLLNIFQTMQRPGIRIWRKEYPNYELNYLRKSGIVKVIPPPPKKEVRRKHIRDLALVVNTGGYYRAEDE